MISIVYFGPLKKLLNRSQEQIEWQNICTNTLIAQLRQRGNTWAEALSDKNIFRLVVNKQIIYEPVQIKDGDEIAILPPVTGG